MEETKKKKEKVKKPKNPVQLIYEWESPERIWSQKDRVWYLFYAAVFAVFILISARLGYFIMILGLLALMFLWFVQATIEPLITKHQITSKGIITRGTLIKWEQLNRFWIGRKPETDLLYIDYKEEEKLPRITLLLIPDQDQDQIVFNHLIEHLKYSNPEEAEVNILSRIIYGEYLPMSNYLQDLDQLD